MRRLSKFLLLFAWLTVATFLLSFVWGNYPHLFFYPPESLSTWLINIYGSSNGEELADLELLYVFVGSFFIVVILTSVFLLLKRALTRRST